jgi:branched-chain amino acid transport system ATP-binding protein
MLEAKALCAGYGSVPVLRDISFAIAPGEIMLIVGENGAGKTTLLRTLGGFIVPTSGSVTLGDEDITGLRPEAMPDKGLRLVLDGHRVFPGLSVLDNLRLGATHRITKTGFAKAIEDVFAMFPVLQQNLRVRSRDLSGGQQQMLALGQAFVAQPKVLLCDEPSTGLAQALLPGILEFLRRWAQRGTAIVIVEQHIRIALPVADRVLLMERGEVTSNSDAAEFERNYAVF